MGRAPCCDKSNVKRGPWSPEEDAALRSYVEKHGIGGNWIALPQKAGLRRCGKSCRLRWLNYLRPDIKHGGFTEEEDNIIYSLYQRIGSRWSVIASHLKGRTDNDVKNYWNTKLKKRVQLSPAPSNSMATPSPQALPTPTFKNEDFSLNIDPGYVLNQGMMLPMYPTHTSLVNYQQYDFTSNATTTDRDSSAASSSVDNWSGNINVSSSGYDDVLLSEFSGLEFYSELFPFYSSTVACKPEPERITYS